MAAKRATCIMAGKPAFDLTSHSTQRDLDTCLLHNIWDDA